MLRLNNEQPTVDADHAMEHTDDNDAEYEMDDMYGAHPIEIERNAHAGNADSRTSAENVDYPVCDEPTVFYDSDAEDADC
ncbi:uncharacterized protein A1O5_03812 [Cladophialophora psammophila CBS 110553]|uniref:Uncharacterized protein n=1 Tax=Cladophialophora psammophila CBS 110553 TaxID=1182543 RepID=W9X6W2_9EURO|nr:uncharacterized protein A1O5_03812 [Cladophialophora psammophila CBS 110553]EXJ72666.1 hypothetical protein A1O5_03812 [Cladophialophora psammophila CBS 110553]